MSAKERVFEAIRDYMLDNNYPPTIREISEMSKVASIAYVKSCLDELRDDGRIDFIDNKSRTISIPGIIYMDVKEK